MGDGEVGDSGTHPFPQSPFPLYTIHYPAIHYPTMRYVNFGSAGVKVSRIALGMGLRSPRRPPNPFTPSSADASSARIEGRAQGSPDCRAPAR